MIICDQHTLSQEGLEIVNRIGKREITHVFHDIDGTHSLIRQWHPVMSVTLEYTILEGLKEGYDSPENTAMLIARSTEPHLEETDRFCTESAGLSALTQMEWAIRRAIEEKTIDLGLDRQAMQTNSEIIQRIWQGEETFDTFWEPAPVKDYLKEHTPRLFRLYEKILNGACRDRNLATALENPETMRVKGSLAFMKRLKDLGVKNYFVTGAVIDYDAAGNPYGGMYEEVLGVGFEIGPGKDVEALYGSTWDKKKPKIDVMYDICRGQNLDLSKVMIVGDGRSEIEAGVKMGAVTVSRLDADAGRQIQIHKQLGTNMIITDYTSKDFLDMFFAS